MLWRWFVGEAEVDGKCQSDGEGEVSGSVKWGEYFVFDEVSDSGEERVFRDGFGGSSGIDSIDVRGVEEVSF